ncbi:MAG: zf-HC2 domain-containing protein [Nitrospirae bacterium]|nr:zf-HC2 domain-containing protein [Nitrospirota bacterium]
MKCSNTQKLISPYIDNELSEVGKKELEDHIEVCGKCRAELEEMRSLRDLFVNTEKFEAPFGFHAKVMANVKTAKTGRLFWVPLPVRFAEAVIVLVLIVAGVMSGTLLAKGLMPGQARDAVAFLHLEVFESAPPGTLGRAYLAMAEAKNEK